ncbi:unnamed protein product [Heligmosomoides polygyrus]|uniref:Reverse transcriptase domain-containing protein n=1 Tax=Heligmosomoides polygyrus TaxID=6339 RepID=A0A183GB59_HELPZ|nr:unnamed protein product [Heligmosomoides polygyrus]
MLHELHIEGAEAGLTTNMSKTKFMRNKFVGGDRVLFEEVPLQEVEDYVYLGQLLNMKNTKEKSGMGGVQFCERRARELQ